MGKKLKCRRNCGSCNGWRALRCTMCRESGKVQFQVKDYTLRSGEKATAECIADAIFDNRAELVNLPASMNFSMALPSKDCPNCDTTMRLQLPRSLGVMGCPECKDKLSFRISADNIMEPPWKAYNIMRKMDYPYEESMRYDQLRNLVAKRKPGWEYFQEESGVAP